MNVKLFPVAGSLLVQYDFDIVVDPMMLFALLRAACGADMEMHANAMYRACNQLAARWHAREGGGDLHVGAKLQLP